MRALLMTEEERELMLSLTAAVMDWREARKAFLADPALPAERLYQAEERLFKLATELPE